jgi:hypothetical protein
MAAAVQGRIRYASALRILKGPAILSRQLSAQGSGPITSEDFDALGLSVFATQDLAKIGILKPSPVQLLVSLGCVLTQSLQR